MPRETETQIIRANQEINSKLSKLGKMIFKPGSFVDDLEEIADNCDYSFEEPKLKEWAEAYCCEAGRLALYGYGAWKAYDWLKTMAIIG